MENVVSYAGALLAFAGVSAWRLHGAVVPEAFLLPAALWGAHFAKRALESAFLHRFTRRVGWVDAFSEYAYYWGFAAWVAWSVTAPSHRPPPDAMKWAGVLVFALAEAGNLRSHVLLARLRPTGTETERRLPRGFLFERVSCPHYLCEVLSWIGFNLATGTLAGLAFNALGAAILVSWALKRHRAYQAQFDGRDGHELYPPQRRALIPFAL